ncbi:MgtC/SapB family protein [Pedobacter cryoconitis]|uniref:MgtC/SapB family protein n=1 Tax=Pedobacter cryoconitis TaxID=188932 RepID=UPI0017969C9A|nr:MgtC/SapB family protein [Pedobacter cryoconitis]MBB5646052.1 putative Mg2+ transporter-C (MgtC) family protein [Pedobacter cryoconitis]
MVMTIIEFTLRLAIAFLLGAAIGTERQWRQRMAGLRTNMLVCLGACMFVSLGVKVGGDASGRVISYVVSGIGFLGAGVIMKDGLNVRGLNTAATLWCSAAVGASCGLGFIPEAAIVTTFVILTHVIMRPVGIKLSRLPLKSTRIPVAYLLIIKCRQDVENHLRVLLLQFTSNDDKLLLRSLKSTDDGDPSKAVIVAEILANSSEDAIMERIAGRLTIEHEVSEVSWNRAGDENDL